MPGDAVTIVTGSRLHFGLLAPALIQGIGRIFGGVGMMLESPSLRVSVRRADRWSADGPLSQRALAVAQSFSETVRPCEINIEAAPREHAGLGTGTQLSLAVAKGVATLNGLPDNSADQLAPRAGRGVRSALGIHGFDKGGFMVDGGKAPDAAVAPLIARYDFPDDWRVVLIDPGGEGLAGTQERNAFARLDSTLEVTEALCRLALLGILPALVERDLSAFGEALYEFNRRVGEVFRRTQGGVYCSPETAQAVQLLRDQGVRGAGQSSWGPTVFGITDVEQASWLEKRLTPGVIITRAKNAGAAISV